MGLKDLQSYNVFPHLKMEYSDDDKGVFFFDLSPIAQWRFDGKKPFPGLILVPCKIKLLNPNLKFILETLGKKSIFSLESLAQIR